MDNPVKPVSKPKLQWVPLVTDGSDDRSVSATYMGIDFYVEVMEDGKFQRSIMIHGALYELGPVAIRQRAINRMEAIFHEMLDNPTDTMRIAEKYSKD